MPGWQCLSREQNRKITKSLNTMNETERLKKTARHYRTLYEIGNLILSEMELESLLKLAMDKVIEITGAQSGFVALVDENELPEFKTARNLEKSDIDNPRFQVSMSIIKHVILTGEAICLEDAVADPRFSSEESVQKLELLSVLCLPVVSKEQIIALIYVENRNKKRAFDQSVVDLLIKFSQQVAIALKNATVYSGLQYEKNQLVEELRSQYRFEEIVGSGAPMSKLLESITKIADSDATVLISGETGTGKELIARALHFNSSRADKPFVAVQCGAIAETLIEDELFGHIKGSFTSAYQNKRGKFELADGGTLFLDEIGEMTAAMQVKLLRVLQNGTFTPVGGEKEKHCNVRVIGATNRDLKKMVENKTFRQDLYYRLNVINLNAPPLKERREDILPLAHHFLKKYSQTENHPVLSKETEQLLQEYDYPGNIRELENIISHAIAFCKGDQILIDHLPEDLKSIESYSYEGVTFQECKQQAVEEWERREIDKLLSLSKGNVRKAARIGKMDLSTLHGKIKRYKIKPEDFK